MGRQLVSCSFHLNHQIHQIRSIFFLLGSVFKHLTTQAAYQSICFSLQYAQIAISAILAAFVTTSLPTNMADLEVSTVQPVCAGYIQSTILLQLYNAPNQSYTQYSYVYTATASKTTLMFCFLNEENFWALDDVTMKDCTTNVEKIHDGGFELGSWTYWTGYNSIYYASGMSTGYNSWPPYDGNYFYLDAEYTAVDGIFQNVSTVVGKNYSISFYLANPLRGNVSVAIVSVGS